MALVDLHRDGWGYLLWGIATDRCQVSVNLSRFTGYVSVASLMD